MNQIVRASKTGEVLSSDDVVYVIGQPHPMAEQRVVSTFPAGMSIAEMLAGVRSKTLLPHMLYLWVDGDLVPAEWWPRVRPKAGTTIVFKAALQNGTALRGVLSLAIAVAAAVIAPELVAAVGITGEAGFTTAFITGAKAVVSLGIVAGSTLALNSLFPIRPPLLAQEEGFTTLASIQGGRNQATLYEAIPQVLGEHQFAPPYAAKAYTELVGDQQYFIQLFCWGYGPLDVPLASLKIGQTPLAAFADYQIEHRAGLPGDAPISLYPTQVDEQALAIELPSIGGSVLGTVLADVDIQWQSRNTSPNTDRISVEFTWPDGVFFRDIVSGNLNAFPSFARARYRVAGSGSGWTYFTPAYLEVTRATKTIRLGAVASVARGQYEVQAGKATKSGSLVDPDNIKDKLVWSALRSFTNDHPVKFGKPLALTALRIKVTNQLNGVIDTFNGVPRSLVTAYSGAAWVPNTVSSNCADLYRHVLQGNANPRPKADAEIDLANLAAWWVYCRDNDFTFNMVRGRSRVPEALADIAAAGRAVPTFIDGKFGVVWDRPNDPIIHHFTPRNSWGFSTSRVYPRAPHAWRVRFVNALNGYTVDEEIVYDDGYSAVNATLFEGIEFPGVVFPDLNWRHGRYHIADVRLRPERSTFYTGWGHLALTRGDRIRLTHDALLIGLGSGRVKSIAGQVVTFDETLTIEAGKTYGVRFLLADPGNTSVLRAVDTAPLGPVVPGEYSALTLVGDLSALQGGELFAFGETDRDSAVYRVLSIAHHDDLVAQITVVDDAPDIALADTGAIPHYSPNITIPPDPFSLPPQGLQYQEVIDGVGASVRALVRLSWTMPRLGKVTGFEVQSRDDGSGADWITWEAVPVPRMTSDVPIISAGAWSFRARCLFSDGTVSDWVSLLGLNLVGLSLPPPNVRNLREEVINGQSYLSWDPADDVRNPAAEVRKGPSFETGLVVGAAVAESKFASTGDGTYWLAFFVVSPFGKKIYSVNPLSIVTQDTVLERNIIVEHDEKNEGWPGGLFGGVISAGLIQTNNTLGSAIVDPVAAEIVNQLGLGDQIVTIYLSSRIVDIGRAAECRFKATYEGVGSLQGEDFLGGGDVLGGPDFLGSANTRFIKAFPIWRFAITGVPDVFGPADVFSPPDVFDVGIDWQPWTKLAAGTRFARFYRAGYVLISEKADVNAVGSAFNWFVDVPDRVDHYTNLTVPIGGLDITFVAGGYDAAEPLGAVHTAFNFGPNDAALPHTKPSIVSGVAGDKVRVENLTLAGCRLFVDDASNAAVERGGVGVLVFGG